MADIRGRVSRTDDGTAFEHRMSEPSFQAFPSPARNSEGKRAHSASSSMEFGELHTPDEERPRSPRSSFSHVDPEPGFAVIDGEVDGLTGLNETKVDIICVPCPGASALDTWCRDPFPDEYFKLRAEDGLKLHPTVTELAGDAILTPAINRHLPRASFVWVRQGIRKSVNTARVMLYRHQALSEGLTLDDLAQDLLDQLQSSREGLSPSRPLFFIGHSVGGLVVKLALLKASKIQEYKPVIYTCHGVAFFATPHQGSSYLTMKNLKDSIQSLLHLQRPLPRSLADELRLGSKTLLRLREQFLNLASELRIWSFYETKDSQLSSGYGLGWAGEVQFGAPLVSIKSGLVGIRREAVFAVESDHAHCASFGPRNANTMTAFLEQLAQAVEHAVHLSDQYTHTPLKLKKEVKVEVIGFYEDRDTEVEPTIRLYHTKYPFADFLLKGPEQCLAERLSKKARRRRPRSRTKPQSQGSPVRKGESSGLGIWTDMSRKLFGHSTEEPSNTEAQDSPDIVVTLPSARPSPISGEGSKSLPLEDLRRPHSLTVPAPLMPNFRRPSTRGSDGTASTMSEPVAQAVSPTGVDPAVAKRNETDLLRREAEQLENVTALHEMSAGFSRPDAANRRFLWIHLPFTNSLWVQDVFDKLGEASGHNLSKFFSNENWVSRHVLGRHSQSQPAFVKPGCSFVQAESINSPRASPVANGRTTSAANPSYLYLYLPYLNFDTYSSVVQRRKVINRRLAHGRARPVPQDIHDLNLELKVIWEYLGYDPPLHTRRTLDQFGYPSLRDTNARDDDQMLYKLTKEDSHLLGVSLKDQMKLWANNVTLPPPAVKQETSHLSAMTGATTKTEDTDAVPDNVSDTTPESDLKDGKVIMVDQLWLWAIDTNNELNGDLTGRTENALDLAAFVALHAVTVLLDRSPHPDLEIFRIFEEAIGLLTERMTFSLKEFRMQTFKEISDEDEDDDPEENSAATIKQRYKLELEKAERENRENTSAVLELRDMEDELTTLLRLFETQETTLKTMKASYLSDTLKDITHNGQVYLDEALLHLDEYKQQTNEMLKRVDITRKDYEKILEMAQRQAQVDDMRWSRLQTELASSQNLSVMIFTIFTVIFLPLGFFTGLFGMNTAEWQDAQVPTLGFIGAISLPVSAFLIVASLVGAFNLRVQGLVYKAYKAARRTLRAVCRLVASEPATADAGPGAVRARKKSRAELERSEEKARRRKDRAYDFWATVRRERGDSRYQIPELNRIREPRSKGEHRRRTWRSKE